MNDETTVKEALPVDFNSGDCQDVQIKLDEKAARKARARERLADRASYERMGIRVLKLKVNTYRMLKAQIAELGIKTIGHCSIMIGREKAESVVAELDAIAKQWDEDGTIIDPAVRIHLQQLKLDCIKIIVESGAEHLKAERQPSEPPPSKGIQLPFEAGIPTAIIYGNPPAKIEDAQPSG